MQFEFLEGYLVDEFGVVVNRKTGKIRTPQQRNDYLSVSIKGKNYPIHRLVAKSFIPNPNNLPIVRHLNGNRFNNHVSNLAWGTAEDNSVDAVSHGTHTFLNSEKFKKQQNCANVPAKVCRKRRNDLPMGVSERIKAKEIKYIAKMANQKSGQVYLGSFNTIEEAYEVVKEWYFEQYGVYPNE